MGQAGQTPQPGSVGVFLGLSRELILNHPIIHIDIEQQLFHLAA
jgi:hypothetical protein